MAHYHRIPSPSLLPTSPPPAFHVASQSRALHQRFNHKYALTLGRADVTCIIALEASQSHPYQYTMALSIEAGSIERMIGSPVNLTMSGDPRQLDFTCFALPRRSLPSDCLYNLRVWLSSQGVDQRVFADDAVWIGKDLDFQSIDHAEFAVSRENIDQYTRVYTGEVGEAEVKFIFELKEASRPQSMHIISATYYAGGVTRPLFSDVRLRIFCKLEDIDFVVYTVPTESNPRLSSHKLRIWIRSGNGVSQRIWKDEQFRVGGMLNFRSLGPTAIIAQRLDDGPSEEWSSTRLTEVAPDENGVDVTGSDTNLSRKRPEL